MSVAEGIEQERQEHMHSPDRRTGWGEALVESGTREPIEHLTPIGMSGEFAALLAARRGWRPAQVALFDAGFSLYWTRSAALARRTATWPA